MTLANKKGQCNIASKARLSNPTQFLSPGPRNVFYVTVFRKAFSIVLWSSLTQLIATSLSFIIFYTLYQPFPLPLFILCIK